jgi:Protein of unknown function (DUF2934)
MAAEKKPRAAKAKAETKSTSTRKAAAAKPKIVRARKPKAPAVTAEQVAERAYYIWADGSGGDPFANWIRAERELQTA